MRIAQELKRRSWAILGPSPGFSSSPPCVLPDSAVLFRAGLAVPGPLGFHTLKGSSSDSDLPVSMCFHRVHRPLYLSYSYSHSSTCINGYTCLWQQVCGTLRCLGQIGSKRYTCLWQDKPLNPLANVEKSGGGYSWLGQQNKGSAVEVKRDHFHERSTVSERATGAAGTGRTARRAEALGRLPASRSRGRAKRP